MQNYNNPIEYTNESNVSPVELHITFFMSIFAVSKRI